MNVNRPLGNIWKEILILLGVSIAIALLVNALSPSGIAVFGNWDTTAGVLSAKPKGYQDTLFEEISDVASAKVIFDRGDAIFIDARSEESFLMGHIAGAASLPIGKFAEKMPMLLDRYEPSTLMITYCSGRTCDDSHKLAQLLATIGYLNVRIFIDGYPAWEEKGFPSE
jgi:rhodanese-related sulfurtransferase